MIWLNSVIGGDLFEVVPALPDRSINAVVTSPPYAMQRRKHYGGIAEQDYAAWTVRWMETIRPKLTDNGNVAIVIRPHVRNGGISDYVLRTRLALREAGWNEVEEIIWIKPTAPPVGHTQRPRRSWESVLWFSQSKRPWCDTRPDGIAVTSDEIGIRMDGNMVRRGFSNGNRKGGYYPGIARVRDYVEVGTGAMGRQQTGHPAQFPSKLADWLIRLLCPVGGVVADPFAGSGTTLLAARAACRNYVGCDVSPEYVRMAERRLLDGCQTATETTPCSVISELA